MSPDCLLDTNVLLYAALGADSAPRKRDVARGIIATKNYATSAQVLAEFYTNATKRQKWDVPLSPETAANWVAVLSAKPCADVDSAVVMRGLELAMRYDLPYWDSAILSAAEALGVSTVYSEDLNDGQTYGSVQVVNPFKPNSTFQ